MNTDEFNKYMEEIQLYECKTVNPFEDQSPKGNYVFGYFENTDQLQNNALASLPSLNKKKIEQNLIKLKMLRTKFLKFEHTYNNLLLTSNTELLTIEHLKKQLIPFDLICFDIKLIDEIFLNVLYDTFLYRLHSLVDLINRTEDFMVEKGLSEHRPSQENSSLYV